MLRPTSSVSELSRAALELRSPETRRALPRSTLARLRFPGVSTGVFSEACLESGGSTMQVSPTATPAWLLEMTLLAAAPFAWGGGLGQGRGGGLRPDPRALLGRRWAPHGCSAVKWYAREPPNTAGPGADFPPNSETAGSLNRHAGPGTTRNVVSICFQPLGVGPGA